jgi:hypothetical protein
MNNFFQNSPPLMSDGRNFANWQPVPVINEIIRQKEHLRTNLQYRTYLQTNADAIIVYNREVASRESSNYPKSSTDLLSRSPYLYGTSTGGPAFFYETDLQSSYLAKHA